MSKIKLYLGDCLEIMQELEDGSVDLVFADPPYNIGKGYGDLVDDKMIATDYWEWTRDWLDNTWRILSTNGSGYFKNHWCNVGKFDMEISNLDNAVIRNLIVWQKEGGLSSTKCYSMRFEPIWFVTNGDEYIFNLDDIRVPSKTNDKRNNPNGKNPTDCWRIPRVAFGSKQRVDHPTQCPLDLLIRIITASSNPGDTILDPFMGSGTTGVACVQTGRNFIGIEIEPKYYEIAEKRIAEAKLQIRMEL